MYSVKTYAYAKKDEDKWLNCKERSFDESINILHNKQDKHLNLRIDPTKDCIVFGDIDHCPDEDTANTIFKMICDEFNVKDVSKSFCYKENEKEYSYHWSIPSLKTNIKTLKHIFSQDKYTQFKNGTHKLVDDAPYKNGWFRLPYQTAKEKPLTQEIIQGDVKDFFVQNIPDEAKVFKYEIPILIKKVIKKVNKKVSDNKQNIDKKNIDNHMKIVNLIDVEYLQNYESWLKIMWAMKKEGFTEEEAKTISKKAQNYTDEGFMNTWNKSQDEITISQGTLNYYAKLSNQEEYYKLNDNYFMNINTMTKGALSIAECISPKLERHLKWSNEKWFMFYNKTNLWVETKEPSHIIVQMIHKHIDYSIQMKIKERSSNEDTDKQKIITDEIAKYSKMYSEVDKSGFYSMITKHLKTILYDSEFYYKLDNNPYKIAFQDGIYDMRENKFDEGYCEDDYITKTIPFDYTKPTQEQTDFVKNVILKICNCNQSHMDYYLGVLGQAMLGDAELEKALYFCVGVGGNNGKTLILEALADIMPNYVSKIERKTFEKGYAKAHKHLVGTKGKRIVYVEELSSKEQEIEVLKEIGDGKTIKNEIMFGTDELINIMFKLIFLSNCQANMKVDGGIGNRYRQLCHNSKFNKDTTEDNYEKLDFIQDKTLANKLKDEYKYALVQLLLDAGYEYTKTNKLNIPDEFEEATKNTLENNDEVKIWFDEYCEYGDDFKCSKKELEGCLGKPFREIQSEIQRITNLKYDYSMKYKGNRGGFKGFRIKIDNIVGYQLNDE